MPSLKKAILTLSLALLFGSATGLATQAETNKTYTATAVHGIPGQPETYGKIVKSGQNLRLEFNRDGRDVVQILLPKLGAMYILDPASKTYMEILGPSVPETDVDGYVSPCPGQAESPQCQHVGDEKISGVTVERWTIASQQNSRPLTVWWNSPRRRALRQDFPEGGNMSMAFKAMETVAGRTAEHWTISLNLPGQETKSGDWWFDPELRVVIRERLPGGETRRLEDIVVGPVDPALFLVPQGWTKQEPPAIGQQAPQNPPSGN